MIQINLSRHASHLISSHLQAHENSASSSCCLSSPQGNAFFCIWGSSASAQVQFCPVRLLAGFTLDTAGSIAQHPLVQCIKARQEAALPIIHSIPAMLQQASSGKQPSQLLNSLLPFFSYVLACPGNNSGVDLPLSFQTDSSKRLSTCLCSPVSLGDCGVAASICPRVPQDI